MRARISELFLEFHNGLGPLAVSLLQSRHLYRERVLPFGQKTSFLRRREPLALSPL